jgi:hypothetical protein
VTEASAAANLRAAARDRGVTGATVCSESTDGVDDSASSVRIAGDVRASTAVSSTVSTVTAAAV